MNPTSTPRARGFDAYFFMEDPTNPFEENTGEHSEWELGYKEAQEFDENTAR